MDGQSQQQPPAASAGPWAGRLKGVWGGLKPIQRFGIIAAFLTLIGVALVATLWTQTPDYATLYTGLSEEDAGAVVDQLKTLKIPYQLEQGGATIQVPSRQVYEARLEMAKQGLPKGSTVGFELFDGGQLSSMGMTDFMQRVNYQRALEGELARTISSLEPIASARVHIVMPEATLFLNEKRDPTASIVLQLKPHSNLSRDQAQAITHLLASSVEGLKPQNITLVDMLGTVLAGGDADSSTAGLGVTSTQLEAQRKYERDLEQRLQLMLDQSLGNSRAIVRVSAVLNWDQKQINSETYSSPGDGNGIMRSEQTEEESFDGTGSAQTGGIPGVDSNTIAPVYPVGAAGTPGASKYAKKTTTRNFELSKVVQTVTQAPGTVQRLSVAVLLDEKLGADVATQIQGMIGTATGVDTSRGDSVIVQSIPFAISQSEEQAASLAKAERNKQVVDLAKLVIMILVVLIIMRFAWLIFRDLSRRLGPEPESYLRVVQEADVPEELRGATVAQLSERSTTVPMTISTAATAGVGGIDGTVAATAAGQAANGYDAAGVPIVPKLSAEENPVRRHLMDLAQRRPELLADLVQVWLAES